MWLPAVMPAVNVAFEPLHGYRYVISVSFSFNRKNSTCIQCINTNSSVNSNHTLTLLFDGYNVSLDGELFAYKEDPEITSVDPTTFIKA